MSQLRLQPTRVAGVRCLRAGLSSLLTIVVLASLSACNRSSQSDAGQRLRLTVGQIKEVSLTGRSPVVGTSENQEIVDVSQRPFTAADSTAMQQGNAVPTVFLIKGVTVGTARVVFSEKSADEIGSGRVRRAYVVQVRSE